MSEKTYTVMFTRDEDNGYIVTVPALKGLVTYGETIEEAEAMAVDAIQCYLEGLMKDGLPFPSEDDEEVTSVKRLSVAIG
ncbi:MAG TPA: type II toxin-antitoxin system HicB family antitoxin [Bacteroidetes bacterium]|nr:type II toxin-antitoxin system HicB family antitoxin [Bacteroidota bacterium]HEX04463.1 type II toxin-antitoxin system HicB family antitoxin [Bacteroidota bacterium]